MEYAKLKGFLREKCVICHNQISFSKDKYVELKDYDGKRRTGRCFYHLDCWKNRWKINQQKAMQEFVKPILSQFADKIKGVENVQI